MSEMIERVAKAICERLFGPFDPAETGSTTVSQQSRLAASDAIAAIRDPTKAMIEAAGSEHAAVPPREAWQAMIDEVLR